MIDLERKDRKMFTVDTYQHPEIVLFDVQPTPEIQALLSDLTPDTPWGERQVAAQKLGYMRDPAALPGLLAVLPTDPFWMVRCAIIQALEMIDDPGVISTLREVEKNDDFQVVRAYAAKAIERLLA